MKKVLLLFVLILFTNILYSQNEYKISTEGFTFGKPVGDNVKLTVYLSATNIGSVEEFSGQLRNIKLTSGKYNTESYYPEDYKRIIDNDKEISGYTVFLLSYTVPVNASDLALVLPDNYGKLNISITKDDYKRWYAKSEQSKSSKTKSIYPSFFSKYVGAGWGFDIGVLDNSTRKSKTSGVLSLSVELLPKLFKFGKEKQSVLFGIIGFNLGVMLEPNVNNLKKMYSPDTNSYKLQDGDSTSFYYTSYGVGLGYYFDIGNVNPVISASLVNTTMIPFDLYENNREMQSYSAWGLKVEAGLQFINNVMLSYVFRYFKIDGESEYLNKYHKMHLIRISMWGWDK